MTRRDPLRDLGQRVAEANRAALAERSVLTAVRCRLLATPKNVDMRPGLELGDRRCGVACVAGALVGLVAG